MLGEELDKRVHAYLTSLRENGAVINTAITMACALGVVKSHDSNLLECNGGHISLTKNWSKYLMECMRFVKRRASTKAKVSVSDFEHLKAQFVFDVKVTIEMEEVPGDLVIKPESTMYQCRVGRWPRRVQTSRNSGNCRQKTDHCCVWWHHDW